MEKVYPPDKFVCSERIPLNTTFEQFYEVCALKKIPNTENLDDLRRNEILLNTLNVETNKQRMELLDDTSINLLKDDDDCIPVDHSTQNRILMKYTKPTQITEKALKLNTVKMRQSYKEKIADIYTKYRYQKDAFVRDGVVKNSTTKNIELGSEFAVAIRIYYPYEYHSSTATNFYNLKFNHTIVALGSNTLAELRDKIICQTDMGLSVEIRDPTQEIPESSAKKEYPSGFIFIENVFYNDMRFENCIDYSEVIRKWAELKGIGTLNVATSEQTKIKDLTLRFGYPYLYQHQAKCEHILIFSDAWCISNQDSLNLADYPMYQNFHKPSSKHCLICYVKYAEWICIDCDRLPHKKTHLCQECFFHYNYLNGKKIGKFKVYKFYDTSYAK